MNNAAKMNIEQRIDKFMNELYQKAQVAIDNDKTYDFDVGDFIAQYGNKKISDIKSEPLNKWTEYGWVPILPSFKGNDILSTLIPPDNSEKADVFMTKKLNKHEMNVMFNELHKHADLYNHNDNILSEAISAFNNQLYSGCSLLLFAMIDACFITFQPTSLKSRRALAERAAKDKIKKIDSYRLSCANTTLCIIKEIFKNADDFATVNDNKLNRNFLSHGMNKYMPTYKDCLKVFVLLYSTYVLFDTNVFKWKK